MQTRDGDIDTFFRHEHASVPPSLTDDNLMYKGTKAEIVPILEKCLPRHVSMIEEPNSQVPINNEPSVPNVDAVILDGAVIVNSIPPDTNTSFVEYATKKFVPCVQAQLNISQRVDLVWDRYLQDSLKKQERLNRGQGQRRKVIPTSRVPRNRPSFLRVDQNKEELFSLLGNEVLKIDTNKTVIVTTGEEVKSNKPDALSPSLMPCTQEEADTRIFTHAADIVQNGLLKVMIITVDSDVVVLAVSLFQELDLEELWVKYGVGDCTRYVPAHDISSSLGPFKSCTLPLFHALTGCDTVSAFKHKGKRTAWDTWKVYPELTTTLLSLMDNPTLTPESLAVIERFVILMYDRGSDLFDVDHGRHVKNFFPVEMDKLIKFHQRKLH